ncbi:helix-turn-helix transcriptional regulator [Streptomyces sp. NPDC051976]|uniref:helix-turn-helix domain-containing protein n=1 Tax=Streptomyces sp. NPDC051976 TaxID=3154947 RepID=UPI00341615B5
MSEGGFGELLRARRGGAALTQEELAERSGLSVRAIRDLEHGRVARPRRETVRMLATALGLRDDDREELLLLARQGSPAARLRPAVTEPVAEPAAERVAASIASSVAAPVTAAEPAGAEDRGPAVVPAPATPPTARTGARRRRHTVSYALLLAALLTVNAQSCYRGPLPATPPASRHTPAPSHTTGRAVSGVWVASYDTAPGQASTTGDDLQVLRPVARDGALIVTVALTGTGPDTVSVTDTAGNRYRPAGKVESADKRHKLYLFALMHARPLDTLDVITVHWPRTTDAHVTVDAFDGVTSAGPHGGMYSDNGYNKESEPLASGDLALCPAGDYLFAAVSTPDGTGAQLDTPWAPITGPQLSSPTLATAYRAIASANDHCEAHGTAAMPWLILTLHLH